jgi:hypothetical protein
MSRAIALALLGCLAAAPTSARAETFSISFRWCSGSSEIALRGVPAGTATLDARMVDRWVPSYDHGGGRIAYAGRKSIPCGALSGFRGPSPPPGQIHDYEWTVRALAADGRELAVAKAERKFPEK